MNGCGSRPGRASRGAAADRPASGSLWPLALLVVVSALVAAATACRRAPDLAGTFDSPEALASAVLDAFASRDRTRLAALALDEVEFRAVVWPELPASRPERNVPFDYVWSDLQQKSRARLTELLAGHGGKRYALVKVAFTGDTTRYASFLVRRDSELTVRAEDGREHTLRLFGSMLQTGDGRFKVFSYNVDD